MSVIDVFMAGLVIAIAILTLRYEKPRGPVDFIVLTILVWGAVMGVFYLASIV